MVMMGTEASGSTNRTTPFLSASFCWPRLWVMCQLLLPSARHYRRLVALSGMIQQRPDLHPLIQSARRLCSTSASHFGFIGLALQALRLHHWAWTEEWTIVRNGITADLWCVLIAEWRHFARQALRLTQWCIASGLRFRDMAGMVKPRCAFFNIDLDFQLAC